MRVCNILGIILAVLLLSPSAHADTPIKTEIKDRDGKILGEEWYISQPDVTVARKEYPGIVYGPNDTIHVDAGGCVQTGGHGKTCKRYVHPLGADGDMYRGKIYLPATVGCPASSDLENIESVLDKDYKVARGPHDADDVTYFVTLGYKDDDYADNGYYSMDKGDDDQCQGEGWAWVRIKITYGNPKDPAATPGAPDKDMDIWWNAIDDNHFPLNPIWGYQYRTKKVPDACNLCDCFQVKDGALAVQNCTTWEPTYDEPSTIFSTCHLVDPLGHGVHGHINWGYVTYTGAIYFADFQRWPLDGDYDMELVRDDEAGVTTGNTFRPPSGGKRAIDLEFNSNETIDYFDLPWWSSFHSAVDQHQFPWQDWAAAQQMVDGKQAIVIGLMGLDNVHEAKAEIHPVLGLAICTSQTADAEVWQVFARNSGNEGSCSSQRHDLPTGNAGLSFFFPNTSAIESSSTTVHQNTTGCSWGAKSYSDGVVVTFWMPDPGVGAVMHGELHFIRKPNVPIPAQIVTRIPMDPLSKLRRNFEEVNGPEEDEAKSLERLLNAMPQKKREDFIFLAQAAEKRLRKERLAAVSRLGLPQRNDDKVVAAHAVLTPSDKRDKAPAAATAALQTYDLIDEARRLELFRCFETAVGSRDKAFALYMDAYADPDAGSDRKLLNDQVEQIEERLNRLDIELRPKPARDGAR